MWPATRQLPDAAAAGLVGRAVKPVLAPQQPEENDAHEMGMQEHIWVQSWLALAAP